MEAQKQKIVDEIMALSNEDFERYEPQIRIIAKSLSLTGDEVAEYRSQRELASLIMDMTDKQFEEYANFFKTFQVLTDNFKC